VSPHKPFFPRVPRSRFQVGQRVGIVGSAPARFGTIDEVIHRGRHVVYRLKRSPLLWFESDLSEVKA
jgi:hypothetical protein